MDAISVPKRTISILFAGLLVAGSAMAQITVSSNSVTLNNSATFQTINVSSSPSGTAFTFTITETDSSSLPWLRAFVGGNCAGTGCATGNGMSGSGTTN